MNAGIAVTWLFVPGSRPERFEKALRSGADAVICDLEDSVAPADKALARDSVAGWLADGGKAWVRINAPGSAWSEEDVLRLAGVRGVLGLMVPKAESPVVLADVSRRAGQLPLIALVETARGVVDAASLAASPSVARLAFGSIDYAADVQAVESEQSLLLARSVLVLASRAAGKPAPIDGVSTEVVHMEPVEAAAAYARGLGFGGKLCVHPRQVPATAAGFAPGPAEVAWAQKVVAAGSEKGVVAVDGQMVDKPVLERARHVLARAGQAP